MPLLSSSLFWLLAACGMLLVGPVVYQKLNRYPFIHSLIDGFVLASIFVLVFLHVLPEAAHEIGILAFGLALVGLLLPSLFERLQTRLNTEVAFFAFAIAGLLIHTAFDGMALTSTHGVSLATGLAVILHRFPVGLTVWWLVRPTYGWKAAAGVMALLCLSTTLGFGFGSEILDDMPRALPYIQSFVGGSLLHVIFHQSHEHDHGFPKKVTTPEAIGALTVLLTALIFSPDVGSHASHNHVGAHAEHLHGGFSPFESLNDVSTLTGSFFHLLLESAPSLLVGYLLAGLLSVVLVSVPIGWMSNGPRFLQAIRGTIIGLPMPVCSCGVVPLFSTLVRRGLPPAAALAFLIATPELGVDSFFLSFSLLGSDIAITRIIAAGLIAIGVATIVSFTLPKASPLEGEVLVEKTPLKHRLLAGLRFGLVEVVDDTLPWIFVGLGIAAIVNIYLDPAVLGSWPASIQILLFSVIGIPMYVCASGATPLGAALILAGVSPGAVVAFLISGPATNVTTFGVVTRHFGRRTALLFGILVVLSAVLFGFIINAIGTIVEVSPMRGGNEDQPWYEWASVAGMLPLFVMSLFRLGPRRFLSKVLPLPDSLQSSGCGGGEGDSCGHETSHNHSGCSHTHDSHQHHSHDNTDTDSHHRHHCDNNSCHENSHHHSGCNHTHDSHHHHSHHNTDTDSHHHHHCDNNSCHENSHHHSGCSHTHDSHQHHHSHDNTDTDSHHHHCDNNSCHENSRHHSGCSHTHDSHQHHSHHNTDIDSHHHHCNEGSCREKSHSNAEGKIKSHSNAEGKIRSHGTCTADDAEKDVLETGCGDGCSPK